MFFGGVIGRRAHWIAVPALAGSFVASCSRLLGRRVRRQRSPATLFRWIVAGDFETAVTAHVDPLTGVMLLVVTGVGSLIHLYSIGYMHDDPGYARYFAYLNLFVVLDDDAGARPATSCSSTSSGRRSGLCSYLLIGFWYTRQVGGATRARRRSSSTASATSASASASCGSGPRSARSTTASVFAAAADLSPPDGDRHRAAPLPGRVRQVGPAAAATPGCPTRWRARRRSPRSSTPRRWSRPASTWSRAATCSSSARRPRSRSSRWVGVATALFAATIGLVQTDIKRVLAYSTVSQLGYMFAARRRRRVRGRHLPPRDARLLQGAPVPRRRQRHPRPRAASRISGRWAGCRRGWCRRRITMHDRRASASRACPGWPGSSRRTRSSPRRSRAGTALDVGAPRCWARS